MREIIVSNNQHSVRRKRSGARLHQIIWSDVKTLVGTHWQRTCSTAFNSPIKQRCKDDASGSRVTSSFEILSVSVIKAGSIQYAYREMIKMMTPIARTRIVKSL